MNCTEYIDYITTPLKYVIATSQKEANELAALIGHDVRAEAEVHLSELRCCVADPHYAVRYKVYVVEAPAQAGPERGSKP